jgi:hypothetical protein
VQKTNVHCEGRTRFAAARSENCTPTPTMLWLSNSVEWDDRNKRIAWPVKNFLSFSINANESDFMLFVF